MEGARTDHVIIKPVTQLPIVNSRAIPWNYERVTVTYKGKEIKEEFCETQGLTRSGSCFAPEKLRKAKISKDNPVLVKNVVTEEEAEEFLRKIKVQDYSIVEQLRKTPAQISLLSLLIHLDERRQALMKILNEAHVPDKITVNYLEKIANKIFEVNRVTCSDDELPVEGTEHNRAVYLTVKCENSVVTQVLVDNGSSANICPLSTLSKLKVEDERIHKNSICVRGFDGRDKDSVGDILLELKIGPVEFTMEFQVLDIVVSYNLLDAIVPFIEMEDDKGPWVYQIFDTMLVEKVPEGKYIPNPKITTASVMVAYEMLKNDFVLGKGLGSSLQGIIQPVSLPENLGTFGLGFKPTTTDIRRAKKLKHRAWVLPKPVPRLSRSFVKSGTKKRPVTTIPSPVIDLDKELIERFEKLFDSVNMVESSKGDTDNIKEIKIRIHLELKIKEEIIKALIEYKDVFAWSYDDMLGLSTDLVIHKLPTDPAFPPVKQKLRKFKTDMSVKIKEEIIKQLDAKVIRVTRYPIWLANIVPVPKKDSKIRVCIDYCNLNNASPKDNFPLPNIHILIDNCTKREIGSFVDCYAGRRGIELDPSKIKAIQELPLPRNKTEVMSLLGRLNYISRFIAQLTTTCEPILKLLKKDVAVEWTEECQEAFEKIKGYLSNPPMLPMPTGRLAKWQSFLTEFDIVYVTWTVMKAQALTDHLAKDPVDEEYEPLRTYFPDEEVMHIDELEQTEKLGWKLFFDGAANMKGVGI
ncbi:uncharacterized protein [Nicotiana sylvestris]|uniref:uncharacterized protein n=1 Tax=Nicotiana sylvestris TaxID=4096 RepID=UPI00388CCB7C